jgi:hypothetical protein
MIIGTENVSRKSGGHITASGEEALRDMLTSMAGHTK